MTVNVVSWFGKEQNDWKKKKNNLASQSKLFNTKVRHSIEIGKDGVMNYLTLKILLQLPMNNDFELR